MRLAETMFFITALGVSVAFNAAPNLARAQTGAPSDATDLGAGREEDSASKRSPVRISGKELENRVRTRAAKLYPGDDPALRMAALRAAMRAEFDKQVPTFGERPQKPYVRDGEPRSKNSASVDARPHSGKLADPPPTSDDLSSAPDHAPFRPQDALNSAALVSFDTDYDPRYRKWLDGRLSDPITTLEFPEGGEMELYIWRGSRAKPGQLNELTLVFERKPNPFCSGVLIDPKTVLTAAHCLCESIPTHVFLGVGPPPAGGPESGRLIKVVDHRRRGVDCAAAHDSWSRYNSLAGKDFGVLRLKSAVAGGIARPRPLPSFQNGAANYVVSRFQAGVFELLVAGFGESEARAPQIKAAAKVPIISPNCSPRYFHESVDDRTGYGCDENNELLAGPRPRDSGPSIRNGLETINFKDLRRHGPGAAPQSGAASIASTSATVLQPIGACLGDSGGPAYLLDRALGHKWIGLISRNAKKSPHHVTGASGECGKGQIISLLTPASIKWIKDATAAMKK